MTLEIINLTKKKTPSLSWQKAKDRILGKKYELSVVISGDKRMRSLNRQYREKDKTANVLSFPYSKTEGEIFLNAKEEKNRMTLLYIHALLHLKGLKHGLKMEKEEDRYLEIL